MKSILWKLTKAVAFAGILLLMILYCGVFLRPPGKDNGASKNLYGQEKNTVDVALIGSSALYRYWISPQAYDEYGFTSCTLAYAGQDVDVIPYLIEEIMKTQKPKVICVETRRLAQVYLKELKGKANKERRDFFTTNFLSGVHLGSTKFKILHDMLDLTWEQELEFLFPLLKYHENFYNLPLSQLIEENKQDYITQMNELTLATVRRQHYKKVPDDKLPDLEFPESYLSILDTIVETADQYGTEVLFIGTPYVADARGQKLRKSLNEYLDTKGYHYLDMVSIPYEMDLDFSTDFYNVNHTNIVGAKKVTSYLGQFLVDHYTFDTSLSTKSQALWNDYVERWQEKEKEVLQEWEMNCAELEKEEQEKKEQEK